MEIEDDKEAAVTLGISIPFNPSKHIETHSLQIKTHSAVSSVYDNQPFENSTQRLQFSNLPAALDPNLGILGKLPSSNIVYEKGTFNCWNIEPHFLHTLPLSTGCSCESSILLFGGINPSSVLRKNPVDLDHDDYVLGSTIFQYLITSGVWKYYGTMIEPRCYHACAFDVDEQYVYVTGGYSLLKREHGEMLAVSSTDRLNINDRQWKRCANMVTARAAHASAFHRSFLYVFGGRCSEGNILSSVEIYNPDHDAWAELTSIPRPSMGLCATCTSDRVWIVGGITSDSSRNPSKCLLRNVYSFSLSTKRWNKEPSLPYACAFSSCVSNEHSLWLAGGCTFSKNTENDVMVSCSSVLQLSLSVKPSKWIYVASLLYPRHALTAVLHDECIYVLAGMESTNYDASTAIEVISTTTNTNIECSNIPVAVAGCTSVIINQDTDGTQCTECDRNYIHSTSNTISDFAENEYCIKKKDYSVESIEASKTSGNISEADIKDHAFSLVSDRNHPEKEKYSNDTFYETKENKYFIPSETIEETKLKLENLEEKDLLNTHQTSKERMDDFPNVRYRASMEIFLNSHSENKETGSNHSSKKNLSASKWLNFFNTLSISDEELHKEIFESKEPKLSIKTEIDSSKSNDSLGKSAEVKYFEGLSDLNKLSYAKSNSNNAVSTCVQDAMPSRQQSFLYVQSNLKSHALDTEASVKDFENKNLVKSFDDISTHTATKMEMDNLDVPTNMEKIAIYEEPFPIILMMGGEYPANNDKSKYILMYSCTKNVWKYVGLMPEYRCHHSVAYFNNKIFIIGGYDALTSKLYENITSKTICYDIYHETWYHAASMNHPRAYHSTVLLQNEIFVLGGRDELGNILASVEAYDESKNQWRDCKQQPYPVLGAAAAVLNGILYVFGGITYRDENEIISSSTSMYDLQNNSWSFGPDMPIPLAFCGISTYLNSVLVFGGLKEEDGNIISGKDIFKFDILGEVWIKVAKLSVPRHASITVSIGSDVYVIGGHSTQDKKEVLTCELIDMSKNEISTKNRLPAAVSGRAGILIAALYKYNTET